MADVIEQVAARLDELGIEAEVADTSKPYPPRHTPTIVLRRGRSRQEYALIARRRVSLTDVGTTETDLPIFAATSSIAPKTAESFRRAGVQYTDAAGNAWVRFDDVLIDVRGRRLANDHGPHPRTTGNLFSTARARVAFALLAWPALWDAPQRELAGAASVSLGQANNALALFRESGFGPAQGGRSAELLNLWAAAFPSGLAQKLIIATYRGSADSVQKVHAEDAAFISGELAVKELLRPASLTIYIEQFDPRLPIVNRWRSDGPPNIVLCHKFWTTPKHASHDYDGPFTGMRNAPWPLVYADLLASDDPRVRAASKEWRRQFARLEQDT